LLYGFFLILLPRWERQIHGLQKAWHYIGLTGRSNLFFPLIKGVLTGMACIALLAGLQVLFGWARVVPGHQNWVGLIGAGGLTALAVGWAEELLFRGWLLRELERGWGAFPALLGTSFLFALAHFIKPLDVILATLPQFLGLLLLGLVLGWSRRLAIPQRDGTTTTSLGSPIGLHSGLVWGYYILNVGGLLEPASPVPDWVTGIDGNPLAGMLGILLLTGLALWVYFRSHRHTL
jgi:hypothetical protein